MNAVSDQAQDHLQVPPHVLHTVDAISAVAVAGAIAGALPWITALAGLIWYFMQMYDWIQRKRRARMLRRRKDDGLLPRV